MRIDGWRLPSRQPRLILAQLAINFRAPVGDDRAIKVQTSSQYEGKLRSALAALKEYAAHILVYPEFSWPFQAAVDAAPYLKQCLPDGGLCVMPMEHILFDQYAELLRHYEVAPNLLERELATTMASVAPADQQRAIVNPSLIIVKSENRLHVVPQTKMRPAGLEESPKVGRWILAGSPIRRVIEGEDCSVAVVICFDLIAHDQARGERPRDALGATRLDLLLVPECNPQPLHQAYAIAMTALNDTPTWSSRRPVIVCVNVARGTSLPHLGIVPAYFGFSRAIGDLGAVSPPLRHVFSVIDGIVTAMSPTALLDLKEVDYPTIRSMVIRPQESLGVIDLPTVGGPPTHDPSVGRVNTKCEVLRRVGGPDPRWQRIRRARYEHVGVETAGIPKDLIVGRFVGAAVLHDEFVAALQQSITPLWITGEGGGGKTALTATALANRIEGRTARVIWVDMAQIGPTEEDLMEALLRQLGKSSAPSLDTESQRRVLQQELQTPTVLVLDSRERWPATLPSWIAPLHQWPSRVVVTSREAPAAGVTFRVSPLASEYALSLIRATAERDIDPRLTNLLYDAVKGMPLGCLWVGGLLRGGTNIEESLRDQLAAEPEQALRNIFETCIAELSPLALRVLEVLCELPAPVDSGDLASILDVAPAAIDPTIDELVRGNFVMRDLIAGQPRSTGYYTKHPFVRQFWPQVRSASAGSAARQAIVSWCVKIVTEYGGDQNWAGFQHLEARWRNIKTVLESLAQAGLEDRTRFLGLCREIDYFLWSTGRWRERIGLGIKAVELARALGVADMEAHALFESLAETQWHRGLNRPEAEANLDAASAIYAALGRPVDVAKVEYYRGRLARHTESSDSLRIADLATSLARVAGDSHVLGLSLNGLGNVHRDAGRSQDAGRCYEEAQPLLEATGDKEMLGVIHRNRGRVYIDRGLYGEAITELESALDIFRELRLQVEEAEAGNYHAKALAGLGEFADAKEEIESVMQTFHALGSALRAREVEKTKKWIEERETEVAG